MRNEVDFLYILKDNENVQIEGTVFIPEDEDVEDYEYDVKYETPNGKFDEVMVNHYGVGLTPTDEQISECEKLRELFEQDSMFLTRICDYADTNTALDLGEVYLVIDDCDYREYLNL